MLVILLFVSKILLGFTVGHLFWRDRHFLPLVLKIFIGIPLGIGLSSLLFYVWLWLAFPRPAYPWLEILLTITFFTILVWKARPFPWNDAAILPQNSGGIIIFFTLASAITGIVFFIVYSVKFPHGLFEDAWFIWNMAARFLYRSNDWTLIFRSQSTLWHPDYPLLLSLNIVQGWLINGGETTRVPIIMAGLFTFSIPAILFVATLILRDLKQASLAAFFLMTTPWFIMHGTEQVADVPISAYYLSSAVLLILYIRQRDRSLLILSGLMAGLSAWTKNEGIYFWLIGGLVCFLTGLRFGKMPQAFFLFLLGSLLPIGVVLSFKLFLSPGSDLVQNYAEILSKVIDPARYAMIFSEFGRYISGFGGWPVSIFWVLVLYSAIMGFDIEDRAELFLIALLPALQLAGYFIIYLITPRDLYWHLTSSLGRLLIQIFPLSLFVLMVALRSPEKLFRTQKLAGGASDQ